MTGSALIDFLIVLIALGGAVAIMFAALPKISEDPTFVQIARIAIGIVAVVALLLAVKAVLFGGSGPGVMSPMGVIYFAIAVIVILVVVMLIKWFIAWLQLPFGNIAIYVIGAIALIAFLYAAAVFLFGGAAALGVGKMGRLTGLPIQIEAQA